MSLKWPLFLSLFHTIVLLDLALGTEELDQASFDSLLKSGKNGMVKFYQPWCGHCTRMKPDWDLLAERAHPSVFIADVNCQVEVSLCGEFHAGGNYPTVLIFEHRKEPELYEGGRGFEDLIRFVDQNLVEPCNIDRNLLEETCSEREQKYMRKWQTKSLEDLKKEQARLSSMNDDRETMTYDLLKWLGDRINILAQLQLQTAAEQEL